MPIAIPHNSNLIPRKIRGKGDGREKGNIEARPCCCMGDLCVVFLYGKQPSIQFQSWRRIQTIFFCAPKARRNCNIPRFCKPRLLPVAINWSIRAKQLSICFITLSRAFRASQHKTFKRLSVVIQKKSKF